MSLTRTGSCRPLSRESHVLSETLYGTAFAQYTREHNLEKLGMNDIYFDEDLQTATRNGRRSQGFARKNQDVYACAEDEARQGSSDECLGVKVNIGHFDPSLEKAAGHWGIVSSVEDMVSRTERSRSILTDRLCGSLLGFGSCYYAAGPLPRTKRSSRNRSSKWPQHHTASPSRTRSSIFPNSERSHTAWDSR